MPLAIMLGANCFIDMIQIDDVIISLDVFKEKFICDIKACKGACCVDGDAGAPLEKEEVKKLEEVLPALWNDLSSAAKKVIKEEGVAYTDMDGDLVTSLVNGRDCVFTCYEPDGTCICAVEKAYREGKTDFYKPISCHLYPIRVVQLGEYQGLNYHRWGVCKAAVALGKRKGVPVYKFLKEPLIRKFGQVWYDELERSEVELRDNGYLD